MTRAEFIKKWKVHLAGTIALGTGKARVILLGAFNGKSSAEEVLREIEETAETLLGRLYDDLQPKPAPKNGQATPARK